MNWLDNLVVRYKNWVMERKMLAALKREELNRRLDSLIEVENEKAIIRVKRKKLEALRNKGRPSGTKAKKNFTPNYFGKGFSGEKVDYFKKW